MNIRLKYFGMISEITQKEEETLELAAHSNINPLLELLSHKYDRLNKMEYKVAINELIENENIELKENDIVALLPPFAGG